MSINQNLCSIEHIEQIQQEGYQISYIEYWSEDLFRVWMTRKVIIDSAQAVFEMLNPFVSRETAQILKASETPGEQS